MLEITVDTHIRIANLPEKWRVPLAGLAAFKNEEKAKAVKEMIYGAKKMDDLLTLADIDNEDFILPRGVLLKLTNLLDETGHKYQLTDNTVYQGEPTYFSDAPVLTDEQTPAVEAILKQKSGRIIMPTGSGKTVVALGAIACIRRPTIVLVDKLHIAKQWRDRAYEHLGFVAGIVGDKQWEEKDITIALLQTLHSRREELDDEWWGKWSVVFHDEQHHIPADSYQGVVEMFPARYRVGFSATIGKSKAKKKISELVYGPIIYEYKEQKIKPEVKVIETAFDFDYQPTHKVKGKDGRLKVVRNNYQDLIKTLIEDHKRNKLIADTIFSEKDRANLVVSRRLNQLGDLRNMVLDLGFPEERCWTLTGKESSDERMEIAEKADAGECVIFSTVADEALDIPRLDRLYLVFPQKNEETIKQQVGRLTREHPDKDNCLVYDFVDVSIGIIKNQFGHRLRNFYQREELTVYKIGAQPSPS